MEQSARERDREGSSVFALDLGFVLTVLVAACATGSGLVVMTGLVSVLWLARLAVAALAGPREERWAEVAIFLAATLAGAANDFNTVVLHGVYRYRAEVFHPASGEIPLWMLLYWGLILRFAAGFVWRLSGHRFPVTRGLEGWPRLAALAALVASTRLSIFRMHDDPFWSWVPFALAGVAYFALLRPTRALALAFALTLVIGTAAEALLIRVAGLHEYDLPLVGGVPLWISLWWPLGVLVWQELAARMRRRLIRQEC